ncbi:MAG: flagellar hook-basal body complex protein, partial [Oscillospiraceae bacterium]|nr:flagellar hook-basal body complex protein [Oscillospiraceae bacterium]
TTFTDVYYQTLNPGRGAGATTGGQNPTQIGYGSQVATIDMLMTNGGGQYTGRPHDVYIDGDGFISVQDADGRTHYTRLGNLTFDNDGWLVDYSGYKVLGVQLNATSGNQTGEPITPTNGTFWAQGDLEQIQLKDVTRIWDDKANGGAGDWVVNTDNIRDFIGNISIGRDGSITAIVDRQLEYEGQIFQKDEAVYLGKLAIGTFANPYGLSERGNSYFDEAPNSGAVRYTTPELNGAGQSKSSYLEMANVDLSQEFTDMITTQRGFQANTRIITVSDEMLQELVNLKR